MAKLFETPPVFELPLTKGNDLYFGIVYKTLVVDGDGKPVLDGNGKKQYQEAPYPDGATVAVVLETSPPSAENLTIDAEISGSVALIWGQSESVDGIGAGRLWRATITYEDGLDRVLCNGKTVRSDG